MKESLRLLLRGVIGISLYFLYAKAVTAQIMDLEAKKEGLFGEEMVNQNWNIYYDDNVAFKYPTNFLLQADDLSASYHLESGNIFLNIDILEEFRWKQFKDIALNSAKNSTTLIDGKVVELNIETSIEQYSKYNFQGLLIKSFLRPKAQQQLLHLNENKLFLRRGEKCLFVNASNDDATLTDILDFVISSFAFPGEDLYKNSIAGGLRKMIDDSPNIVKLKFFKDFGRLSNDRKFQFNVIYEGKYISAQQKCAVDSFLTNESILFDQSKEAIFRYYRDYILPLYAQEGLVDDSHLIPNIGTINEVLSFVEFLEIYIHEELSDGTVSIGLRFQCDWSCDGVGIRVIGNKVVAVGNDYVALGIEDGWEGFIQGNLMP